jgi:hypothetical protein
MMFYCYNDYKSFSYSMYVGDEHTNETKDIIWFQSGRYYEHMGFTNFGTMRLMKSDDGRILSFGDWKNYFLESDEDRDRKLKLLT